MSGIEAAENDVVKAGDIIGYTGDSGYTPYCRLLLCPWENVVM